MATFPSILDVCGETNQPQCLALGCLDAPRLNILHSYKTAPAARVGRKIPAAMNK